MFKKLEWDSAFFGYPVAEVDLDFAVWNSTLLSVLKKQSIRLVYIKSSSNNTPQPIREDLDRIGAQYVDCKFVYFRELSESFLKPSKPTVLHKETTLTDELLSLALESGHLSRFRVDPNFQNREFERLYEQWIQNSLKNQLDSEVWSIRDTATSLLKGFVSIDHLNSTTGPAIGLIAVSQKHRGQGIGKTLVHHAFQRSLENRHKTLQVATQKSNLSACHLYETCQMSPIQKIDYWHLWL